MTASYLTPKPSSSCGEHKLPSCPPPPRAAHKTIDVQSFPSLRLPRRFPDLIPSDDKNAKGFMLASPGLSKRSSTKKVLPVKRSHDGRDNSRLSPLPFFTLKPRPSKYSPPSRPVSTNGKTRLNSLTRTASFERAFRMGMDSKKRRTTLTRRPSFSRAA